eukprot:SAG22_NODE_283_length_13027_cov_25.568535_9_plen_157_part_00
MRSCSTQKDEVFVKKWQLACEEDIAHVVVMPNVTRPKIDQFVLQLVVRQTIKQPPPCRSATRARPGPARWPARVLRPADGRAVACVSRRNLSLSSLQASAEKYGRWEPVRPDSPLSQLQDSSWGGAMNSAALDAAGNATVPDLEFFKMGESTKSAL